MFHLLKPLVQTLQPFLVPLCFLSAWALVVLVLWSLWSATRDTVKQTQRMHQIPCADCQFFTSDYHLKCTVHPSTALTEDAIDCMDFEARKTAYTSTQNRVYR